LNELTYYGSNYLPQRRKLVLELMAEMGFNADEPEAFSFFSIIIFHTMIKKTEGKCFEEILSDFEKVKVISLCRKHGGIKRFLAFINHKVGKRIFEAYKEST